MTLQLHPDLTRVMATCAKSNQKDQGLSGLPWGGLRGGCSREVGDERSWGASDQDTTYTCTELVKTKKGYFKTENKLILNNLRVKMAVCRRV